MVKLILAACCLVWAAADAASVDDYDTHLCAIAQRLLINADSSFPVTEQRGTSNGFHTIQ